MSGATGDERHAHERPAVDEDALGDLQRLFASEHEARLLRSVLGDGPRRLADMRVALTARDVDALGWAAEALRGAAELVGARPLSALCVRLAREARAGNWELAQGLVGALDEEYASVRTRLEAELRRGRRAGDAE